MIHARGTFKRTATFPAWLTLVVLSVVPTLAAAGITARLQHAEIPVDRATRLMVSLSGTSSGKPRLPEVSGLRFIPSGTSSQMQFVNGQMSSAVTYTFHVQASKTGDFTIPGITADINGKVESTEPIKLRVVKGVGAAPRSRQSVQPVLPRSRGTSKSTPTGSLGKESAFMELETGKGQLYMGEMIPVTIKAYFREGLGVSVAPPQVEGDAFVLHDLSDEPKKSRVQVGDGIYTMLTWSSAISAIKEGRYPIKAKLDATIQVPTQRSRRRRPFDDDFFGGSFFNDDFFNQFFGGVEERQVALATDLRRIRVKPLPEKGRPQDFGGAVGRFELSASAKPTKARVGDPITLEMTVSGNGNFDRVTPPVLADDAGWKTYEPSDTFKGTDSSGYRGRKRFEQAIVSERAGIKAIPAVRFSYFDTGSETYRTVETEPIPVTLTGAPAVSSVVRSTPKPDGAPRAAAGTGLVPIHLELGRRASLEPLATQTWFLWLQALPLGALVLGLLLYRRHSKTLASPEWVQKNERHRKVTESLRATELAVQQGDPEAFIHAGQRAVREQLAESWHLRPDAITLAELNTRLPHGYEGIRRVFEAADALAYSGQSFQANDIEQWRQQVVAELEMLTHQQATEEK